MDTFSNALAEAHMADLHREAARARNRAAARAGRRSSSPVAASVTLRLAAEADAPALASLAARDSSEVPAAPLLIAESDGEPLAALSLSDGAVIADPFHPTAPLVELLDRRANQLRDDRSPRLRRLGARVRRVARGDRHGRMVVQTR